jgi:hypothetical protein
MDEEGGEEEKTVPCSLRRHSQLQFILLKNPAMGCSRKGKGERKGGREQW